MSSKCIELHYIRTCCSFCFFLKNTKQIQFQILSINYRNINVLNMFVSQIRPHTYRMRFWFKVQHIKSIKLAIHKHVFLIICFIKHFLNSSICAKDILTLL